MALPKKKMAGKPAMMMKKKSSMRKAKNGEEVKTVERGETGEVKVRPGFGRSIKDVAQNFYKMDVFDAKDAKTKAGKFIRKAGNTAVKAALTPSLAAGAVPYGAMMATERAIKNKQDLNKIPENKMGGKVKKAAMGASLKPVPAGKKGLAKLPTPVRNKMGFQKNGGKMKK
jgi:hypothetical protein